jgi:hypothetical protein
MSTLNILPKIIYDGNGDQVDFGVPFPVKEKTEVKIAVLRAGASEETYFDYGQFKFSEEPTEDNGGKIRFPGDELPNEAILGAGDKLCVFRESRLGNDYVFTNQTRLLPQSVEDADDMLSLQIMDLSRDLSLSVKASPFDQRTPRQRWDEIRAELKRAQDILNYVDKEILTVPTKLLEEQQARTQGDAAILQQVATNKEDCNAKIAAVENAIQEEKSMREDADKAFVKTSKLALCLTNAFVVSEENSVSLQFDTRNTVSGDTYTSVRALPVASEAQHGIMPKEAYSSLVNLEPRVSALEGGQAKTYAILMGEGPFTQDDYQSAWELASGAAEGSTPPDGTKITNITTNIDIQYFASQNAWIERQVSVPIATAETTGVVKSSSAKGKVAVEADGSMSMNGYDELTSNISSTTSALSSEVSRAKAAEEETNSSLSAHTNDAVRHITESERTAWNGKYAKLDSGIPAEDLDVSIQNKLADAVTQTGGGVMGAKLMARNSTEFDSMEVRNIKFTKTDPGNGSELETGCILMVFE